MNKIGRLFAMGLAFAGALACGTTIRSVSMLTHDEQVTMMTLWCIARSPLMMGGDLLTSPKKTIALLQNKEVLAVNQDSTGNRQVYRTESEH